MRCDWQTHRSRAESMLSGTCCARTDITQRRPGRFAFRLLWVESHSRRQLALVDSVRSTSAPRPLDRGESIGASVDEPARAASGVAGWIFVPGRLDSSEVAASIAGPPWLFSRRDKAPIATIALKAHFDSVSDAPMTRPDEAGDLSCVVIIERPAAASDPP
jgi:hypothetical protein